MTKMTRSEAKEYLDEKNELFDETLSIAERKAKNDKLIKKVMKEGKIYGDPIVTLNEK